MYAYEIPVCPDIYVDQPAKTEGELDEESILDFVLPSKRAKYELKYFSLPSDPQKDTGMFGNDFTLFQSSQYSSSHRR
jgi:hypothetical protein